MVLWKMQVVCDFLQLRIRESLPETVPPRMQRVIVVSAGAVIEKEFIDETIAVAAESSRILFK